MIKTDQNPSVSEMRIKKSFIQQFSFGTPQYVYFHGLKMIKRGRNPSASLSSDFGNIKNPKIAFAISKLLVNDTYLTLFGKPFLRSEIDWAKKYAEHLKGHDSNISFYPKSGIDECICSICFFRDAPAPFNPKRDCQMASNKPKKFFGFNKKTFLPPRINGKDLGHYCPHWLNPNAE